MQIVIGEDGGCGSILEHSAGDGPAAIASNTFVLDLLIGSVTCANFYLLLLHTEQTKMHLSLYFKAVFTGP